MIQARFSFYIVVLQFTSLINIDCCIGAVYSTYYAWLVDIYQSYTKREFTLIFLTVQYIVRLVYSSYPADIDTGFNTSIKMFVQLFDSLVRYIVGKYLPTWSHFNIVELWMLHCSPIQGTKFLLIYCLIVLFDDIILQQF